ATTTNVSIQGMAGGVAAQTTVQGRSSIGIGESPEIEATWVAYKETGDPVLRNRLIENYYPLVRYISERLLSTLPRSIECDDLTSAGLFGLMDAIDGFDLSRGIKFKTYCTTRVRGSILDELRSQDWVPRLVRLKANKITKALKALNARLGREPTEQEMAEELGIGMPEYQSMIGEANPVTVFSLSDKFDDSQTDGSLEKAEIIADHRIENPLDCVNRRDVIEVLTQNLSHKEKRIVIMYYYEGLTMKEIGRILDLTESRVCQIHSNVIARLKDRIDRGPIGVIS
ncbi:MAG TPA: FliA/WhiG family RNA polymerase sigma factor, partial [Planctomycetota bacterium]|nr:FliA/WhiG family RNA polymerase sigma factor [Planctomycetota bacterium]